MQQHVDTLQNIVDISEKQMVGWECSPTKIISLTITNYYYGFSKKSKSFRSVVNQNWKSFGGVGEGGLESPNYSILEGQMILAK